jgi:class 3 adenylate cyclase
MAEDEAGMHASCTDVRLNIIEPGIALHGARIVKHTGDGFLAEFPSATRAVWFAVTFQDAIRTWNVGRPLGHRLEFRIGINLGDVFVEPHDVFGHNVNIAARLQESAKPGGVLVSHAVVASTRDARLQFEDAGDLTLRHIDEPVRGFHVKLIRRRPAQRGNRYHTTSAESPSLAASAAALHSSSQSGPAERPKPERNMPDLAAVAERALIGRCALVQAPHADFRLPACPGA